MLGVSETNPIPTITIQFEYSAWAVARCFIRLITAGSEEELEQNWGGEEN